MGKQMILELEEREHRILKMKAAEMGTTMRALVKYALVKEFFYLKNGELASKATLIERQPAPVKCNWCEGWCAVPCQADELVKQQGIVGLMSNCQCRGECVHGDPECVAAAEGKRLLSLA